MSFGVTMGPVQGAVVGTLDWRWIFWIQLIVYGSIAPLVVLMPETRSDVIRSRIGKREKTAKSGSAVQEVRTTITRSAKLLTTDPTIISFTIWSAFSFGLIFISTESPDSQLSNDISTAGAHVSQLHKRSDPSV